MILCDVKPSKVQIFSSVIFLHRENETRGKFTQGNFSQVKQFSPGKNLQCDHGYCEHAMRDLRLSGFSDRAITCDRLRLYVNQALYSGIYFVGSQAFCTSESFPCLCHDFGPTCGCGCSQRGMFKCQLIERCFFFSSNGLIQGVVFLFLRIMVG